MIFFYMFLSSVVLFESFRKVRLKKYLYIYIFNLTFSASYTSFLSVVSQAKPFETIADLEKTSLTVGAQEGTTFRNMFRVLKHKHYQAQGLR